MLNSGGKSAAITRAEPELQDESQKLDRFSTLDVERSGFKSQGIDNDSSIDDQLDVNLVDWDGPLDPAMALNWSTLKKWVNLSLLAGLTLVTPFASSMFAPSVALVSEEFHNSNETVATLVVSVYLLGYAFGPLFMAPLSELYGRRIFYYISTVLFMLFNVACAESTNMPMLIVFRVLTGTAGAYPLSIGAGSISDMFKQEERGKVMAIWTLPILLGPSIGPIAGGYLSGSLGWRWDFWFMVILTGAIFILCLIFLAETYPPTILEKKARHLRKTTGNPALQSALKSKMPPRELFLKSIIRPTKMLFTNPIVFGLSVMSAITYGTLYLLFTTIPGVFEDQYGFSSSTVGLTYLGLGIGQMVGVLGFGLVSDAILRRMAKGGELKPEYRLPPLIVGTILIAIGLIWYGWTAHFQVAWIVPILGMGVMGAGVITSFLPVGTYLVDAYTMYAASATAANTVLRSIGGALLPLAGDSMYKALGLGWGNTLLAFISLANLPLVIFFMKKGDAMRAKQNAAMLKSL